MLDTVCSSLLLLLLCTLVQRPCHQLSNQGGMIIAHSGSFQYRADYEGDRAPHRAVKVDFEHMCSVHVVCYLGEGLSSVEYGSALMYLIRKCDICGGTGGRG